MKKKLAIVIIFLLALVSLSIYLFLTKEIIIGSLKIEAGQKQLMEGKTQLANGEARLASGAQKLSRAKKTYNTLTAVPFFALKTLPVAGQIAATVTDKYAGKKIAEGDQQVAAGIKKINAGKAQLAEGQLQLQRGMIKLKHANMIRDACGISAILFTFLTIFSLYFWRKSWSFFKKKPMMRVFKFKTKKLK